jgi:CheY-like chemotaxis protein
MMGTAGKNVLIVDDDRGIRESLAEVLKDEGYGVIEACDGYEALEHLRSGLSPCVILLDLMMPNMDGWQFHAELRRNDALARIPVVVLSADSDAHKKASSMSATEGLPKPLRVEQLLDAVGRNCTCDD